MTPADGGNPEAGAPGGYRNPWAAVVALLIPWWVGSCAEPAPTGMVRVPGGTFLMGTKDPRSMPNERPARPIGVAKFWMDVTPVTNAAFGA